MAEIKFFGIEWYDVKTKVKKLIRGIGYSSFVQNLLCAIIYSYVMLVYHTSRKKYIGKEAVIEMFKKNQNCIVSFWHANIMMMPFVTRKSSKINPNYKYFALASRHGDGQFVSKVISKFGLGIVSGSSKGHRKASRGIDISAFKKIFQELKLGKSLVITPDGPRGPRFKVNGHVVDIAKLSQTPLLPCGCSVSRQIKLNTWDQFRFPLPFSTICFAFEDLIWIAKDSSIEEVEEKKLLLEEKINSATNKADQSFLS